MPFKVQNLSVDLISKQANLVAYDQPFAGGPAPMIQISFHFDPPPAEGSEKDKAIATAKALLQRAASEI